MPRGWHLLLTHEPPTSHARTCSRPRSVCTSSTRERGPFGLIPGSEQTIPASERSIPTSEQTIPASDAIDPRLRGQTPWLHGMSRALRRSTPRLRAHDPPLRGLSPGLRTGRSRGDALPGAGDPHRRGARARRSRRSVRRVEPMLALLSAVLWARAGVSRALRVRPPPEVAEPVPLHGSTSSSSSAAGSSLDSVASSARSALLPARSRRACSFSSIARASSAWSARKRARHSSDSASSMVNSGAISSWSRSSQA